MEDGYFAPRAHGFDVIPNRNYLLAKLLWEQLARAGVKHVVISPGSRSTPLARTAVLSETFFTHIVVDERSAGFFELGLAKSHVGPVALVCTSGSAATHYYPAVIEAAQSGIPLIVITADRPKHLRNSGAMQTIDQTSLFGRYARMYLDLAEPSTDADSLRGTLQWVQRALKSMLMAPQGPIQINVPMDEPLAPIEEDSALCGELYDAVRGDVRDLPAAESTTVDANDRILRSIEDSMCGLIVCGPDAARTSPERVAIHELARSLGWPVFADVASGLRFSGEPNMPYYDLFLRADSLAQIAPDLVLEFGMTPTSKSLTAYLNTHRARTIRIQRDNLPRDPDRRATETIITDVAKFVNEMRGSVKASRDSLLMDPFWRAVAETHAYLGGYRLPHDCELAFVRAALEALPDHSNLVLASSMSIRYADMIAAPAGKSVHVYAQRGTNGIDGTLSHAAGVAEGTRRQTLLITGDLAFWHDLQGLRLVRDCDLLTILLLNNGGGGIFHFLPVAQYRDTFEEIHGTPLGINLADIAKAAGVACTRIKTLDEARERFDEMLPGIYEVTLDRIVNQAAHHYYLDTLLKTLY